MLHKVSGLALASFLTFLTSGEDTLLQDACFQREPLGLGLCCASVTPRIYVVLWTSSCPRLSWIFISFWLQDELVLPRVGAVPLSPSIF